MRRSGVLVFAVLAICLAAIALVISRSAPVAQVVDRPLGQAPAPLVGDSHAPPMREEAIEAVLSSGMGAALAHLPLSFEPNIGQTDPSVDFIARLGATTLFLTGEAAVLSLSGATRSVDEADVADEAATGSESVAVPHHVLRLELVGANLDTSAAGLDQLPGRSNYFVGNDPTRWHSDVPHYARVKYEEIYPGVDLVYYGSDGQLEYDFVVHPGADPGSIRMNFSGAEGLALDDQGNLVLQTAAGEILQRAPIIYQETEGRRQAVGGGFLLDEELNAGFWLDDYDPEVALVIDPVLAFSTFLGGFTMDRSYDVAVDTSGNVFVTGLTGSSDFPTASALYGSLPTSATDVFVTKMSGDGSTLLFSTFIGGADHDQGEGIALDNSGNVYVTGTTRSTDFPVSPSIFICITLPPCPFQINHGGATFDAFLFKLNGAGSSLSYSTYLGGSGDDQGHDIAIDHLGVGNAHIVGRTNSSDFPTAGAVQPQLAVPEFGTSEDAFLTIFNTGGTDLLASTYLGGLYADVALGVTVGSGGSPIVVGRTLSATFPTHNAIQATGHGDFDAFVTIYNNSVTAFIASTYLGGGLFDGAQAVTVDSSDNIYLTGRARSSDFPTTPDAFQRSGSNAVFVTKLTPSASSIVYSTFLGGSYRDDGYDIAVDDEGAVYVTGQTQSTDFPTLYAVRPGYGGGPSDAFVAKLNETGSELRYSTLVGSSGNENTLAGAIALGPDGSVYVAGTTFFTDFPTVAAFQPSSGGADDVFVLKLGEPTLNFWIASSTISRVKPLGPVNRR